MSQSRQLAAIMFTDIVGFTALMGSDEKKTFDILEKNRKIHKPIISTYNGRWIKELGDGVMASFSLVSDAVNAAIKIMESCNAANEYKLCIGIHLAEVVFENDDVFGDGVNIAARIQSAAAPGCIFISEAAHRSISNNADITTRFAKEAILKNVSLPIRMYQVMVAGSEILVPEKPAAVFIEKSIAVLPFANMSSDPEQEYFSDGISEEIINMLAQVPDIKVIARTSCFAFKGKNMDVKLIGEQLKVSHILEGSVRKSGNKLRVTAQLISVSDGFHLYSEKFDRELDDIFAIQDEISLAILNAIKIKLFGAEKDAVLKRYTDNVEAYQLYLQGRYYYNMYNPQAIQKAIFYLEEAIKIDPGYAIAYSGLSFCYLTLWYWNWLPPEKCLPQCLKTAQEALNLDDTIAETHIAIGRVKLHYELNIKEALIDYKKAIAINPNSAECHIQLAFCAVLSGHYAEAKQHAALADSLDPFSLMNLLIIAAIYWGTGDHEKCFAYGKRLMDLEPNLSFGQYAEMEAYWLLHKYEEALPKVEICVKFNPDFLNLSNLGYTYGMTGENGKAREIIEKMKKIEGAELSGHTFFGIVHASIGELDIAFEYFDKGVDGHQGWVLWVRFYLREIPDAMKDPRAWRLFERLGQPYDRYESVQSLKKDIEGVPTKIRPSKNWKYYAAAFLLLFVSFLVANKFILHKPYFSDLFSTSNNELTENQRGAMPLMTDNLPALDINKNKYYALLIGNNDYKYWNKLKHPISDVEQMEQTLVEYYTFEKENIKSIKNGTYDQIYKAFESFNNYSGPNTYLLIYYAGHGIYDKVTEKASLIPVDSEEDSNSKNITSDLIRDLLKKCQIHNILFISDACYLGAMASRGAKKDKVEDVNMSSFSNFAPKKSRKFISSGANETVPDKSEFNYYLIKYLKENNLKYIFEYTLFNAIVGPIESNSLASPVNGVFFDTKDEGGHFFFVKK